LEVRRLAQENDSLANLVVPLRGRFRTGLACQLSPNPKLNQR
jgi:hypothetical protein